MGIDNPLALANAVFLQMGRTCVYVVAVNIIHLNFLSLSLEMTMCSTVKMVLKLAIRISVRKKLLSIIQIQLSEKGVMFHFVFYYNSP